MNPTVLEMLSQIFEVCIIPLLGVLVTYLVKYVNAKSKDISARTDNVLTKKYVDMLADTITQCVIATNQTYVDALKKQGKFDKEAQEAAFKLTSTAVLAILSDEAKKYLTAAYGDLNTYITNQIEKTVNENKLVVAE